MTIDRVIAMNGASWQPGRAGQAKGARPGRADREPAIEDFTFLVHWPRRGQRPAWASASELCQHWKRRERKLVVSTVRDRMKRSMAAGYVKRRKNPKRKGRQNAALWQFNLTDKGRSYQQPGEVYSKLRRAGSEAIGPE